MQLQRYILKTVFFFILELKLTFRKLRSWHPVPSLMAATWADTEAEAPILWPLM